MEAFFTIFGIFFSLWWLWLPVFLVALFLELWVKYVKSKAIKKIRWLLLEVKIPRTIEKTPKAMEQIFSGLHGILTSIKFLDKYWIGKVQEWFSFEIVGIEGIVHFFIRTPEQFKNLVEAQIHAQYSDAEISEVMDYAGLLSKKIPSNDYAIGGAELILEKEDFYPIRTYQAFEEMRAERRIDSMSSFLEVISKLRPDEYIIIQYIIAPTGDKNWKEKGLETINKMAGKKVEIKKSGFENLIGGISEFLGNLIQAPFVYPEWSAKKEDAKTPSVNLSPGDKTIIEAIDIKVAKLAFKVCVRLAYISKKPIFNKANIAAVMGAFKQFNTLNLNGFKGNGKAGTNVDQPRIIPAIKNRRIFLRTIAFMDRLINRKPSKNKKDFILNTEELATIYHYPIVTVETPTLQRVGAKKAEPPVSLPL